MIEKLRNLALYAPVLLLNMTTKTAVIHARIDPELKNDVESVLNDLGLSVMDAITIFFVKSAGKENFRSM
jgi:hypothetical protein